VNQIIEVKIKKLKVNFLATCDLFPHCKGLGKSKNDALQHLSKSISQFISTMVNKTLSGVFTSKNFTNVVMDQTSDPYEEVVGYSLNSKTSSMAKNILFKVPAFISEGSAIIDSDESFDALDADDLDAISFDTLSLPSNRDDENLIDRDDSYEQVMFHQKVNPDSESIMFGFPLNFN
jgi:hypothetical protein